jgi:hypothetical protein
MKYALILSLLLTGCFNIKKCPPQEWREYSYNSKVKVVSGFYKGQTGKIRSKAWTYDGDCSLPAFEVQLDLNGDLVKISQYDLYVEVK